MKIGEIRENFETAVLKMCTVNVSSVLGIRKYGSAFYVGMRRVYKVKHGCQDLFWKIQCTIHANLKFSKQSCSCKSSLLAFVTEYDLECNRIPVLDGLVA